MAQPSFILIAGKRYAGKDYVAARIKEAVPEALLLPLALAVKLEYLKWHPRVTLEELNTPGLKEAHRPGLIHLGMDRRHEDETYWCRQVYHAACEAKARLVIVTDVRFLNEMLFFSQFHHLKVRVDATPHSRIARGWTFNEEVDHHATEIELDHYPYKHVVANDGEGPPDLDAILEWARRAA